MPCYFPLQAKILSDGDSKRVKFGKLDDVRFQFGVSVSSDSIGIPCGRCIGCRLERSRQWAVRCMHESELHEDNCFITLTFDDKHLLEQCPGGSLSRSHMQLFMKRLRSRFSSIKIRTFYCGEYGDMLGRPHYHAILFGFDFPDRLYHSGEGDRQIFTSRILSELWPFGFAVVGNMTFESAAYVARYCVKKINGDLADDHYRGRLPEFCQASLKPGIGRGWIEKFGHTDVFPFDEVIVRGSKCKPPRYYDKFLESIDPVSFERVKVKRSVKASLKSFDNTFSRLKVKEICTKARVKSLRRGYEGGVL